MNQPSPTIIIFFDGMCLLCNAFVDFLLKFDRHNSLHFAPLQGTTAVALSISQDLNTMIFYQEGAVEIKSTAVIKAISALGGGWRIINCFLIIPRTLRDIIYDFIARHRLRWFGSRKKCRKPTKADKDKLLP